MLTPVLEQFTPEYGPSATVPDSVEVLRYELDPDVQLRNLHNPNMHRRSSGAETGQAEGFVEFALDPNSSPSLTVRLEALERALDLGYMAQSQMAYPEEATIRFAARRSCVRTDDEAVRVGKSYRYIAEALVDVEGLDRNMLFPAEQNLAYELSRTNWEDENPVKSFMLLDKLDAELKTGEPSDAALKFQPFIRELHQKLTDITGLPEVPPISFKDWGDVARCTRLLEHGGHYEAIFMNILKSEDAESMRYISLLGELHAMPKTAAKAFPSRYQQGAEKGMQHLVADGLYATLEHLNNGSETKAFIPLNQGAGKLPLNISGQEPVVLLSALRDAFRGLQDVRVSSTAWRPDRTIRVAPSEHFALHRFVGPTGKLKNISAYVRPYGGIDYDSQLEYGRCTEGVEASIGFVVDVSHDGHLLEVGKHRGRSEDSRISIRLDREGVEPGRKGLGAKRDPTQKAGTLSLDVGSVLGKDEWLSTKLGRFLAWGNTLRTNSLGTETHLNHMTEYFTPEDGDAEVFANEATVLAIELERMRLSPREVAGLFASRAAVGAAK